MAECIIVGNNGGGNSDYEFTISENGIFQYPKNVIIPNTVTSLQQSNGIGFYGHSEIETIKFESGSKLTSLPNYCFSNCTGLKEVHIPESVTSIGYSFRDDTALELVVFESDGEKTITLTEILFKIVQILKLYY
jgi:hypothetical protein